MTRERTVSESIVIAVDPEIIYEAVSDPTQMGRWSPENTGAVVEGPRQPAYVGMRFVGSNRRGPFRWRTRCTVTAADHGKHFAFEVGEIGVTSPLIKAPNAAWSYRMEPVEGGTRVTETWEDQRVDLPAPLWWVFDRFALGTSTFPEHSRAGMRETLRRLKADLESRFGPRS